MKRVMESNGVTDIIGLMKCRFNTPATSSTEAMEPSLETSTSGKASSEERELGTLRSDNLSDSEIDLKEENTGSTETIKKLKTDTVVKCGRDLLQNNSPKAPDETPKRTRHRSNSRSVIQNAIARKEKSLRVDENPKYRRSRTSKKLVSTSESSSSSSSIKKQLLQRKPKLTQTDTGKNTLITPESSDECNNTDGNARRSQRILTSENKSSPTSKSEEDDAERAKSLARLCKCNENKQLYMESEADSQFCIAVDNINDKLIGCSRLVDVRTVPMLRPSTRVPFGVYCAAHKQRLIRHNCCPTCGQFCTQGQFAECKSRHHFHKGCKISIEDKECCPHCGDCGSSTDVVITMRSPEKPVFLPVQRSHHPSARISFKDTKDVSTVCNGREASVTPPIIPKMDVLEANSSAETNECNEYGLVEAVENNDLGKVAAILRGSDKIDMKVRLGDYSNGTFLHLAVLKGSVEMVYLLISNHIDIDVLDSDQNSALMLAATEHKNDIVRYLVKAGADVGLKGIDGMTCLHIAAKSGNLEACKVFLDFRLGMSNFVNTQDDGGWTPLVWACEHGYCDVAKYLVSKGADVNIRDVEHNVALHWAAFKGSSRIVELLLNLESDINVLNVHGDTPLHISSREDHYNCVIILLSRKADISIINKNNETPLDCSSKEGSCYSLLALNAQLHQAISGNSSRIPTCLLVNDISRGRELNPIQCCNSIDAEGEPRDYVYIKKNCQTSDSIRINMKVTAVQFCSCKDRCNSLECKCAQMSLKCWYDEQGKLLPEFNFCDPPLIFECNDFCSCNAILCSNRLVQKPLLQRFELFKTVSKGWGVKSLNFIAAGNYVCEYLGELLSDTEAEQREDDSYLFDLDNRETDSYCIDAKHYGNFARFINHSCEPNLHPIKVFVEHHDLRFPRIALFAKRDIAADEELCFDYGEKFWLVKYKAFTCDCGADTCKYSKDRIGSTLKRYQMAL